MDMNNETGVAVVNFKTADLTIECLRSLSLERGLSSFDVIVVDNNSQDGSYELIADAIETEKWRSWASVRASEYNGGFSYGNNIAIKEFIRRGNAPEFIFLLNPDTVVKPNAIKELVTFLSERPHVGIAGSRIEDVNGLALQSSFQFHSWITELNRGFSLGLLTKLLSPWISSDLVPEKAEKTDWVSGASMMIRSSVLEEIGGLDESYFMYYEETDFCLNAALHNWDCWYVPSSRVTHLVGQSSGVDSAGMTKRMPQYWLDSRRRFFLKNHGVLYAVVADLCWLVGFTSWTLRNIFQRKPNINPPKLLRDTFMNSVFVKGIRVNQANTDIRKE